jgi:hypothetical protein
MAQLHDLQSFTQRKTSITKPGKRAEACRAPREVIDGTFNRQLRFF